MSGLEISSRGSGRGRPASSGKGPSVPSSGWARRLLPDLAAAILLAFLCLLFFWRIWAVGLPPGDFLDQFYAFGVYEAAELFQGRLPLWNPYAYGGSPFLADVQSAIFYPLSLLTVGLSGISGGFSPAGLEIEALLHFFLASFFTYLFVRRLVGSRVGALVSAIVFAYGGYLTSYPVQQLAILEVNIWLPLVLLLVDLAVATGRRRYTVLAGLSLGVSLLAGHPQSSMYLLYLSAIYLLARARWAGRPLSASAADLGLFLVVGIGLAAVQLVPSAEYMWLSTRSQAAYSEMASGLQFFDLLQLLLPGSVTTMWPIYVGILPLALAAVALAIRPRAQAIFWASVAAVALVLSLGGNTFAYGPFYLFVPGFDLFRSQERAMFLFSFSMAVLAGVGASTLLRGLVGEERERLGRLSRSVGWLALIAFLAVLLFQYGWTDAGLSGSSRFRSLLSSSVFLLLVLGMSWALLRARLGSFMGRRFLSMAMILLVLVDLFTINGYKGLPEEGAENLWRTTPLIGIPQGDPDIFRLSNEWQLPGNYGCVFRLEDIGGASPLKIRWYDELASAVPEARLWRLMNVKYVITYRKAVSAPSEIVYQEAQGDGASYLHRLADLAPRAFVAYKARGGVVDDEALRLLADEEFDPFEEAILAGPVPPGLSGGTGASSSARILERSPQRLVVEVEAEAEGLLVLSEVFYPGWKAWVDGDEVAILRAQHALRAVPVARGTHRVVMTFEPLSVKIGLAVSALALVLSLGFLAWDWRRAVDA